MTSSNKKRVLVTGASGLIGGLVVKTLGDKYEFSALNRRLVEGIPCTQADIADYDAILPAFEDIDMVVHMATYTDDVDSWDKHLSGSLVGTRNVLEASRVHGVKRVVFGSTGDTMTGYELDFPCGELAAGLYDRVPPQWEMKSYLDPVRPKSIYGVCKAACEALGRLYADAHGLSVLCIRLGAVLDDDRPHLRRHYPGYLSQADCIQMVERCLEAPMSLSFDIFDAISDNRWRWRDTDHAREVLGWSPAGSADRYEIEDVGGWHQVVGDATPPR